MLLIKMCFPVDIPPITYLPTYTLTHNIPSYHMLGIPLIPFHTIPLLFSFFLSFLPISSLKAYLLLIVMTSAVNFGEPHWDPLMSSCSASSILSLTLHTLLVVYSYIRRLSSSGIEACSCTLTDHYASHTLQLDTGRKANLLPIQWI